MFRVAQQYSWYLWYAATVVVGAVTVGIPDTIFAEGSAVRIYAEPKSDDVSPYQLPMRRDVRLPVAINGFSAVALRDQQQWVAGLERYQVVFDAHLYWFADERQRAMFVAAPELYVPALGGDCVVTFAESGRRVPGDTQYGLLYQRRLFFFAGQEQANRFRADPGRYSSADLAHDGHCVVCKIDQQRLVKGLPETVAIVDGLRYHFLGAYQRAVFLANMRRYGIQQTGFSEGDSLPSEDGPYHGYDQIADGSKRLPTEAATTKKGSPSDEPETEPAMDGYSPVSIRDSGQWVLGSSEYRVKLHGKVYLMAGEAERTRFLENPTNYLPALGGDCVVSLVDENLRLPGSVYFPAYYPNQEEGRLFLFSSAEKKNAFKADPEKYAKAVNDEERSDFSEPR